mmetsp:Transcript_4059/g.5275  ORF Transcript_4059/g.5275 Transcript_4059/m.5275 type:complete len:369 (-) Transcript_4059:80-1186(-)
MNNLCEEEITTVRSFVQKIQENPDLLQDDRLTFFRDFLQYASTNFLNNPCERDVPENSLGCDMDEESDISSDEDPDPDLWTVEPQDPSYEEVLEPTESVSDEALETHINKLRSEAAQLIQAGDLSKGIEKINEALRCNPYKAPLWALRAQCYLKWKKPNCAVKDSNRALQYNPENAKALRVRGMAHRYLGNYAQATLDLNAANRVDYDPDTSEVLKFVESRARQLRTKQRVREERRAARHESEERNFYMPRQNKSQTPEASSTAETPFTGASFSGIPKMDSLFQDPEVQAALRDPETAEKLKNLMSNPMSAMQYMQDPKMSKLISKMMSSMNMPSASASGTNSTSAPFNDTSTSKSTSSKPQSSDELD